MLFILVLLVDLGKSLTLLLTQFSTCKNGLIHWNPYPSTQMCPLNKEMQGLAINWSSPLGHTAQLGSHGEEGKEPALFPPTKGL